MLLLLSRHRPRVPCRRGLELAHLSAPRMHAVARRAFASATSMTTSFCPPMHAPPSSPCAPSRLHITPLITAVLCGHHTRYFIGEDGRLTVTALARPHGFGLKCIHARRVIINAHWSMQVHLSALILIPTITSDPFTSLVLDLVCVVTPLRLLPVRPSQSLRHKVCSEGLLRCFVSRRTGPHPENRSQKCLPL